MKIRFKNFIVLLIAFLMLALNVVTPVHANEETAKVNGSTYLRTSYNDENYVAFSISGDTLKIEGRLILDGLTGYMVQVGNNKSYYTASEGQTFSMQCSLKGINKPTSIDIYTKQSYKSLYWSYIWEDVYVAPSDGGYVFLQSSILENNLNMHSQWVNPGDFLNSQVPEAIRAKSAEIVGGETDAYKKIFLLHQWVAKNIYYDYDSFYGKGRTFFDAESVLSNGRSVCAGYAELLKQLIQAQGIPCMETQTYALGLGFSEGSFAINEAEAGHFTSNHAHVEAYVNGRWVLMDPTWDSQNKYENGTYLKEKPNGYHYFDITLEMLALNHKYTSRGDRKMILQWDGTIENRLHGIKGAIPSVWAVEEVNNGISLGIIPYHLQGGYQQNITREEFCETVIQMLMVKYGAATPEILMEKLGLTMVNGVFTDTDNPYVYAAITLNIVAGMEQNVFGANNFIARQEVANMLRCVAGIMGMPMETAYQTILCDEEIMSFWTDDLTIGLTREQAYLMILEVYNMSMGN